MLRTAHLELLLKGCRLYLICLCSNATKMYNPSPGHQCIGMFWAYLVRFGPDEPVVQVLVNSYISGLSMRRALNW